MSEIFAKAGSRVTDRDGNTICFVKNDLKRHSHLSADDFHMFVEGEEPWMPFTPVDPRCVRTSGLMGMQICVEGEWLPKVSNDE